MYSNQRLKMQSNARIEEMKPAILVGKGKLGTFQQYALIRGGKLDVDQSTSIDQDKKEPVVDQAMQFWRRLIMHLGPMPMSRSFGIELTPK